MPGFGPNGVLYTINKHCKTFLEEKWSHLYHAALYLHTQPRLSNQNGSEILQSRCDEQLFLTVRQLVQGGSLSTADQGLTEPRLCQTDPLPRFLEIHRNIDLRVLHLHLNSVQDICDNVEWDEFFVPGDVYRLITKRKHGKAADQHDMRNEFLKSLPGDPAFLPLFTKCILCGIAQGNELFFPISHLDSCTRAILIAPFKPNGLPRPGQITDMFCAIVTGYAVEKVFKSKEELKSKQELSFLEPVQPGCTDPPSRYWYSVLTLQRWLCFCGQGNSRHIGRQ